MGENASKSRRSAGKLGENALKSRRSAGKVGRECTQVETERRKVEKSAYYFATFIRENNSKFPIRSGSQDRVASTAIHRTQKKRFSFSRTELLLQQYIARRKSVLLFQEEKNPLNEVLLDLIRDSLGCMLVTERF
ncbi:hypothetical protein [Virgibacillus proomii]|uniref:hypothetical protein n=1 Tax=Virgibacillus proomii TaxID=84407 RepID=UPI001C106640|nr:hypothetical protein [Virgibacillus proomii]MBU5266798.1 hypothetical protein [Virgibacillus proomii]